MSVFFFCTFGFLSGFFGGVGVHAIINKILIMIGSMMIVIFIRTFNRIPLSIQYLFIK